VPPAGWNEPLLRHQDKKASCCATHQTSPEHEPPVAKHASCCDKKHETTSAPVRTADPTDKSHWVIVISARQCGGQDGSWFTLAEPVSAPPPLIEWNYDASPVSWLRSSQLPAIAATFVPPTPPPRV
jgi:hypothetical protein